MLEGNNEIKWINCAKFVAIIAVLTDHTAGTLYANYRIILASYFSVSLFIIISGMLSFLSIEKHQLSWFVTFVRASRNIVVAYLFANFIYLIYTQRGFDFKVYLQYVINFNISLPFYYVLLYLQLMLVSKPLYNIIKKVPKKYIVFGEIGIGGVILIISSWTTNHTNILNIYGGGGKLLGGTYLFLFYLGMLFSKHDIFRNLTLKKSVIITVSSLVLCIFWWSFAFYHRLALDAKLPFGNGVNPPSLTLGLMAVIMLFLSYGMFSLFQFTKYLNWITSFCSWIGKHTLYIFLFHRFFLDHIIHRFLATENIWLKRVLYFSIMIMGSILIEYAFHWLKKAFVGQHSLKNSEAS